MKDRPKCAYPLCNRTITNFIVAIQRRDKIFCCQDHYEKHQADERRLQEVAHKFHAPDRGQKWWHRDG